MNTQYKLCYTSPGFIVLSKGWLWLGTVLVTLTKCGFHHFTLESICTQHKVTYFH